MQTKTKYVIGATGTALVAYANITGAAITVPSTTVLRISFDELPY